MAILKFPKPVFLISLFIALGTYSSLLGQDVYALAKLVQTSNLPDPQTAPYKDCILFCKVELKQNRGLKEKSRHAIVAFWGFKNRELKAPAKFLKGEDLYLHMIPFENVGEEIESISRANDIEDFDLPVFWALRSHRCFEPIPSGDPGDVDDMLKEPISTEQTPITVEQSDKTAVKLRKEAIQKDIKKIDEALARHGGSWSKWFKELEPLREDLLKQLRANGGKIMYKDGCAFDHITYFYMQLPSKLTSVDQSAKVLIHLNRELKKKGIDLIVAPFPPREAFNYKIFSNLHPSDGIVQPYKLKFFKMMLQNDVEILDSTEFFHKNLSSPSSIYYPAVDRHPADEAIQLMARSVYERLKRYDFLREAREKRESFKTVSTEVKIPKSYQKKFGKLLSVRGTQVLQSNGNLLPLSVPNSPLLVVGDSFTQVPLPYGLKAANFTAHLSNVSGFRSTNLLIGGSAAQVMPNLAIKGAKFLKQRRVCVFSFPLLWLFIPKGQEEVREFNWKLTNLP